VEKRGATGKAGPHPQDCEAGNEALGAVALLVPRCLFFTPRPEVRARLRAAGLPRPETAVKRNAGQNEHKTNRTAIAYTRA